jgi:hypothetical protein
VYVRDTAGGPGAGRIFVPSDVATDEIFGFLTYGLPVESFDGAKLSSPPQPGDRFLLSGYSAEAEATALAPYLGTTPRLLAEGPAFPDGRGPTFFVYETRDAP